MTHDIILLITGFVVGSMNAIAGGGMLVGFPVMVLLGTPAIIANASSSVINIPGQMTSAFVYRDYLRRAPKSFAWLLLPMIAGAFGGATMLKHTSAENFENMVPWLVLFGVALFGLQPWLSKRFHGHLVHTTKVFQWRNLWALLFVLLPMSFYSGYFGAGVGFMMLAFLSFTRVHNDMHTMTALKNVGAVFMATTTASCLLAGHLIDWHVAVFMAIGTVIGGYVGAHVSKRLSGRWLRIAVLIIGLSAAIYLALRQY